MGDWEWHEPQPAAVCADLRAGMGQRLAGEGAGARQAARPGDSRPRHPQAILGPAGNPAGDEAISPLLLRIARANMENFVSSLVPALVAGAVALLVVAINGRISWISHRVKLKADKQLAVDRFGYEKELAERKIKLESDQYVARRNSEFAEKTIEAFYDAASRIAVARSGGSFHSENNDRIGRDQEPQHIRDARDTYYPYVRRLVANSSFMTELHVRRFRAKALFGAEAEAPFVRLWIKWLRLRAAAERLTNNAGQPAGNEAQRLIAERDEQTIWAEYADPDAFANEVDQIVEQAERIFSPAITRPPPA